MERTVAHPYVWQTRPRDESLRALLLLAEPNWTPLLLPTTVGPPSRGPWERAVRRNSARRSDTSRTAGKSCCRHSSPFAAVQADAVHRGSREPVEATYFEDFLAFFACRFS